LLANWLYGVAHHTAMKARASVTRRKGREVQVTEMPEPAVAEQETWDDLQPLLDQELSLLPDAYRAVIVLCDLEGKTRKEAARQLGLPEGTVGSRVARARMMLARRLTRHGLAVSGGSLAAVLAEGAACAGLPPSVVTSTIQAASVPAVGQAAAAGSISGKVAALTEGVVKAMFLKKLKTIATASLVLGILAVGASWLFHAVGVGTLHAQTPAIQKKVATKLELLRLQGSWRPISVVSVKEGGADVSHALKRTRLIIKGNTFRVVSSFDLEMPVDESLTVVVMEGLLEIDPNKTPKTMDWRLKNPRHDKPILKVYEVEGDRLRIVTGSAKERPQSLRPGLDGTRTIFYERDKVYERHQLPPAETPNVEQLENLYPAFEALKDKRKE
jgi:uncharacterized protein (TIGR03067 family)